MKALARLGIFLLIGGAFGWLSKVDVDAIAHSPGYKYFAYTLLAIGLYSSTYSIEPASTVRDGKLILTAVTAGVLVKALLIGGALAILFQNPLYFVLGTAVAQIDPLAVASLMGGNRLSERAKTILAAWSSFDDPITVLLAIYLAAYFALNHPSSTVWLSSLIGNLALAFAVIVAWRLLAAADRRLLGAGDRPGQLVGRDWARYLLLAAALVAAVAYQWMLAAALIGLFCAPKRIASWIPRITSAALALATILLGIVLAGDIRAKGGINPWPGIILGLAAYAAQVLVAAMLTRKLPSRDRIHLGLAQQNGITAIILALALQIDISFAVSVIAPAIVVVNLTHWVVNQTYDRATKSPAVMTN